ncbi:MAG: RNA 2',3'-cyclic phosphodiesterase [Candidatus Eremiobacteraeota bacterium]|nr:RNA 2',3'-cyclic phosphodiesterase [Candidatus Eremiobacteraeota bacterium]
MAVNGAETPRAPRWRLFVAAEIDDAARAACARVADALRAKGFAAKWVPPENYHLTVAFVGAVEESRVPEVASAIRDAVARASALEIPLDAVGAFPNERRVRIVWVGSHAPQPRFATLCGVVRSALSVLGFVFDRHTDAHVTLARAEGRAALPSVPAPKIAPVTIASLALYRSFTERAGARYEPLARFALGAPASGPSGDRANAPPGPRSA